MLWWLWIINELSWNKLEEDLLNFSTYTYLEIEDFFGKFYQWYSLYDNMRRIQPLRWTDYHFYEKREKKDEMDSFDWDSFNMHTIIGSR